MELIGNKKKTIFNLTKEDIGEAIGEYITNKYSFPQCKANVEMTVKAGKTAATMEIQIPMSDVQKKVAE